MAEKHIITNPEELKGQTIQLTDEDLQRDFRYHMAVNITKNLFGEGLISQEECDRICREHVRNYRPTLAPIMP